MSLNVLTFSFAFKHFLLKYMYIIQHTQHASHGQNGRSTNGRSKSVWILCSIRCLIGMRNGGWNSIHQSLSILFDALHFQWIHGTHITFCSSVLGALRFICVFLFDNSDSFVVYIFYFFWFDFLSFHLAFLLSFFCLWYLTTAVIYHSKYGAVVQLLVSGRILCTTTVSTFISRQKPLRLNQKKEEPLTLYLWLLLSLSLRAFIDFAVVLVVVVIVVVGNARQFLRNVLFTVSTYLFSWFFPFCGGIFSVSSARDRLWIS